MPNRLAAHARGSYAGIRRLLRSNDFEAARAATEAILARTPEDSTARLLLGRALQLKGDEFGAEQAYAQTLAHAPELAEAYERWGRLCLERFDPAQARRVFERWQAALPDDPGAKHWLAVCGALPAPAKTDRRLVHALYERFAVDFDEVMDRVSYTGPMLAGAVLERELVAQSASLEVLDAGCGTGLCGTALRPYAERLHGCDLSAAMLQRAEATGRYDHLVEADYMALGADYHARFDVVCSVETLIYFGDLRPPITALAQCLRRPGLLVVTTEVMLAGIASNDEDFELGPSGRYAHSDDHLEGALLAAGLNEITLTRTLLRTEGGEPVEGWLASGWRR